MRKIDRRPLPEWTGLAVIILLTVLGLSYVFPSFTDQYNIYILLQSFCVVLLVAFSQMVTLAVGQINIAVGAMGGLIAILFGGMMEKYGVPIPIAALAAVLLGCASGFINGAITVKSGINGFIITLATASAFSGVAYGITESIPFYNMPPGLLAFGTGRFFAFPYLLIPPLLIAIALAFFLARTVPGRWMVATGGNPHAAELSGIPRDAVIVMAHVMSGFLAAVAAILAVALLGSAQPSIGSDWLVMSFAAPIIAGAALTGGHVSVAATAMAVVLIVLVQNAMVMAQVDSYWVEFLLGCIILTVVGLNQIRAPKAQAVST
jgi:ribose transport system permease protein